MQGYFIPPQSQIEKKPTQTHKISFRWLSSSWSLLVNASKRFLQPFYKFLPDTILNRPSVNTLQQIYVVVLLRFTAYSLMFLALFIRQILTLVVLLPATDNTNMLTEDFSYLAHILSFNRVNVCHTSGREVQFKFSTGDNSRTIVMDFNLNELNQSSTPSKRPHESLQSPPEVEKKNLAKNRGSSSVGEVGIGRNRRARKTHSSRKPIDDESDFVNILSPRKKITTEDNEEDCDEQKNTVGKLNVTEEQKVEALKKWNELPSKLEHEEVQYSNDTVPVDSPQISILLTNVLTADDDDD